MKEKLIEKIKSNDVRLKETENSIEEVKKQTKELEDKQNAILKDVDKANTRETIIGNCVVFFIILSTVISVGTQIDTINIQNFKEIDAMVKLFGIPAITSICAITYAIADCKINMFKLRKKYNIKGKVEQEISNISKKIDFNKEKQNNLEKSASYDKARLDLLYELNEYYDNSKKEVIVEKNIPMVEIEQKENIKQDELQFDLVFNTKKLSRTR